MTAHRVYLVRHARAEAPHRDDASRRLTADGRAQFDRLLGALGGRLAPRRIVTSPYVRARQTAQLLAATTGAPVTEDERLASGASEGPALVAMLRAAAPGTALVGHNPELAEALARVAGKDVEVKPGAIAAVDVDGEDLRLAWLEAPQGA